MKNRTTFSKVILTASILKIIFVLSLVFSLIFWSIPFLSMSSDLWLIFQERSGVILEPEVENYNDLIVEFFRKNIQLNFLNESELSHMNDVRRMISVVNSLAIFSFAIIIFHFLYLSKSDKKFLLGAIRKTSLAVFVITLIISLVILTNFYTVFIIFHKIFFVRNFIFPSDSLLKSLFPDKFFFEISAVYLLSILIVSLIVTIVSHKLKFK